MELSPNKKLMKILKNKPFERGSVSQLFGKETVIN